jgi:hypothetical protein
MEQAVVAYFRVLPDIYLQELRKTTNHPADIAGLLPRF